MPHASHTVSTLTRSQSRVMQYENLLKAAGIASLLADDRIRAGQMTEEEYRDLQNKLRALQEGLDAVWAIQGGQKIMRGFVDSPNLPSLIRLQAC